jgi:hypothetical protein
MGIFVLWRDNGDWGLQYSRAARADRILSLARSDDARPNKSETAM